LNESGLGTDRSTIGIQHPNDRAQRAPQGTRGRGETVAIRPESTAKKEIEPEEVDRGIRSAPLEPIRVVVRELTRPDGKKMKVEVPVYPPFRLEEGSDRAARAVAPDRTPAKTARGRKQAKSRRS
jgi:hypothetical protein